MNGLTIKLFADGAELKSMLDALDDLPEEVRATVKMRITKRNPKSRR